MSLTAVITVSVKLHLFRFKIFGFGVSPKNLFRSHTNTNGGKSLFEEPDGETLGRPRETERTCGFYYELWVLCFTEQEK